MGTPDRWEYMSKIVTQVASSSSIHCVNADIQTIAGCLVRKLYDGDAGEQEIMAWGILCAR